MGESGALVSAVVLFVAVAGTATLMAGIRRIPWRFGAVLGLGTGTVLATAWAATAGLGDPPILVMVGAIGGSVTQQAFDRGQRERRRISDAITAVPGRSTL